MSEVFHIVPAGSRTASMMYPVMGLLFAILVGVGVMLGLSVRGSRASTFTVDAGGLQISGDLYGRQIAASAIRGDAVRVVDMRREQKLQPAMRTMGTALPGYQAGWFRLENGEKALLYLTSREQAVYVPTTLGYSVIMSADRPEEMVARLREVGSAK